MKPAPFEYHSASSVDEAIALLARFGDEAKIIAGGQSLMPLLALRLARPGHLVDLNRIHELSKIAVADGELAIGATVRQRAAERSDLVRDRCPLLAAALPRIGHPAIRNRGTVGGSLAHADPAAELPAVALALEANGSSRRRNSSSAISRPRWNRTSASWRSASPPGPTERGARSRRRAGETETSRWSAWPPFSGSTPEVMWWIRGSLSSASAVRRFAPPTPRRFSAARARAASRSTPPASARFEISSRRRTCTHRGRTDATSRGFWSAVRSNDRRRARGGIDDGEDRDRNDGERPAP